MTVMKCRIIIIAFYFIIFASLNIELWIASPKTSTVKDNFYLYNDFEIREIVNVLIYEMYFVYLILFKLRIFTFRQQMPVFLITFIVLMIHNIYIDIIFESIIIKLIYL